MLKSKKFVSMLMALVMLLSMGCVGVFAEEDSNAGNPESAYEKPLFVHYTEDELDLIPPAPGNPISTRAVLSKTKPTSTLTLTGSNSVLDSFSFTDWVYSSRNFKKSGQIYLVWTKYHTSGTFGVETYEAGTDKYIGYTTVNINTAVTGFNPPDTSKAYYFMFYAITPDITFSGTVQTY